MKKSEFQEVILKNLRHCDARIHYYKSHKDLCYKLLEILDDNEEISEACLDVLIKVHKLQINFFEHHGF